MSGMEEIRFQDTKIQVTGICGSLRDGSYTRRVVRTALDGAEELGASTHLISLQEYDLPFCDGTNNAVPEDSGVAMLRWEVKKSHGIILGTPEYHGSFSGVLKNALDLMGFDEFEGKMLGLVGVSAGMLGGIDALNSLRTIGRALHAWVVPDQAAVPQVQNVIDEDGTYQNTEIREQVKEVGRQVSRFSYLHTSEQTREFVRFWEEAPPNPGAKDR